jgi:hypothetical protein
MYTLKNKPNSANLQAEHTCCQPKGYAGLNEWL